MKIEVSLGEAIDKYSILELKLQKITDESKLIEIKKELDELYDYCNPYIVSFTFFYKLLKYVNGVIWDLTNMIKRMNVSDPQFAIVSNEIFEMNQKRFRIKNWFNIITDSTLKEQKSYNSTYFKITIENIDDIYHKIPEINYLSLEVDSLIIETPHTEIIKKIFKQPSILLNYSDINIQSKNINSIQLEDNSLSVLFGYEPITYVAGGMFGDFIQTLSVICEKFYETGRKGVLYLSNYGDKFRNSLESTFQDTYSVIISQPYIYSYSIYQGEKFDFNLTKWRENKLIYDGSTDTPNNWYDVYKHAYAIEWGKHKWLVVNKDERWKDRIVINTTNYRWPKNIDFQNLYQRFGEDLLFISATPKEYEYFIEQTGLQIEYKQTETFHDLCTIISSCKLFVGSLSAPMAIAHATHTDRIIGQGINNCEIKLNMDLDKIWNNVYYKIV
jgi:hypothetical protein